MEEVLKTIIGGLILEIAKLRSDLQAARAEIVALKSKEVS